MCWEICIGKCGGSQLWWHLRDVLALVVVAFKRCGDYQEMWWLLVVVAFKRCGDHQEMWWLLVVVAFKRCGDFQEMLWLLVVVAFKRCGDSEEMWQRNDSASDCWCSGPGFESTVASFSVKSTEDLQMVTV